MYTRYAEKEMKLYLGMDANGISFSKEGDVYIYTGNKTIDSDLLDYSPNNIYGTVYLLKNSTVEYDMGSTLFYTYNNGTAESMNFSSGSVLTSALENISLISKKNVFLNASSFVHLSSYDKIGIESKNQVQIDSEKVYIGHRRNGNFEAAVKSDQLIFILNNLMDVIIAYSDILTSVPFPQFTVGNSMLNERLGIIKKNIDIIKSKLLEIL